MQFLDIKTFPKYSDRLGSKSRVLVRFECVSIYRIQAPKFLGFPRVLGFFWQPKYITIDGFGSVDMGNKSRV